MGVVVKRAVRVKVVVTEQFKARQSAEVNAVLARLESEAKALIPRLEALRKASGAGPDQMNNLERLESSLRRNEKARGDAAAELERVSRLKIGATVDRGMLEGLVEVNLGDDFTGLVDCEILVKDDLVVEIRDGQCPAVSRR